MQGPFRYGVLTPQMQLAPVVQTLDSAIQRINHYPADKYYGNQLRSPLDSDLSGGLRYPTFEQPRTEAFPQQCWKDPCCFCHTA